MTLTFSGSGRVPFGVRICPLYFILHFRLTQFNFVSIQFESHLTRTVSECHKVTVMISDSFVDSLAFAIHENVIYQAFGALEAFDRFVLTPLKFLRSGRDVERHTEPTISTERSPKSS